MVALETQAAGVCLAAHGASRLGHAVLCQGPESPFSSEGPPPLAPCSAAPLPQAPHPGFWCPCPQGASWAGLTPQDQLLFCDDCDRGYHMYCLSPPMAEPPEGEKRQVPMGVGSGQAAFLPLPGPDSVLWLPPQGAGAVTSAFGT